jgi:hypothetical protein
MMHHADRADFAGEPAGNLAMHARALQHLRPGEPFVERAADDHFVHVPQILREPVERVGIFERGVKAVSLGTDDIACGIGIGGPPAAIINAAPAVKLSRKTTLKNSALSFSKVPK